MCLCIWIAVTLSMMILVTRITLRLLMDSSVVGGLKALFSVGTKVKQEEKDMKLNEITSGEGKQ